MEGLGPFYDLRHGQTDWNRQGLYMGSRDIPLNEEGEKEAMHAAHLLVRENVRCILTSPLLRAKKTAHVIAQALSLPCHEVEALRECDFGLLEGKPHTTLPHPIDLVHLSAQFKAEPLDALCARVTQALHVLKQHEGPCLVVSHGGIYAVLCHLMGWPRRPLPNALPLLHVPPTTNDHPWQIVEIDTCAL